MRKKNNGPPASPDSATFQQLWDALGSKLIESAQGRLLYTRGVRGSSPLTPLLKLKKSFCLMKNSGNSLPQGSSRQWLS